MCKGDAKLCHTKVTCFQLISIIYNLLVFFSPFTRVPKRKYTTYLFCMFIMYAPLRHALISQLLYLSSSYFLLLKPHSHHFTNDYFTRIVCTRPRRRIRIIIGAILISPPHNQSLLYMEFLDC